MAHFAEIKNGIVQCVLVVGDDQEYRGAEFLADDLGLGGTWIQCSYNATIRKQYPGVGFTYDPIRDEFVALQPFPSWTLDANNDWQPPIPKPDGMARWDEDVLAWVVV